MIRSRQGRLGLAAVAAVALAAAGAAFAASKMHGSTATSTRGGFGPQAASGYRGAMPGGNFAPRGDGFGRRAGDPLAAAVTYLGTTESALRTALASGKTLAQVANATSGKSAAGLIDALVAGETKMLAQAVQNGRLTQTQADGLSANLKTRITSMVNGTFRGFGDRGDRDGNGFGPPGGYGGTPGGGRQGTTPPTHI